MNPSILFLGVGKMGLPMARHLHAAGHPVVVNDLDPERMRLAQAAGLTLASDAKAALQQADWVISSLPNDAALNSVAAWLADHGRAGQAWVDTSTVSLSSSSHAAQQVAAKGIEHLRVTVSGNNHMAEAAQLTVLASGPQALFERALPWLRCWGPNQFHLGQGEQARLMKLVINLMIAQTSAMLSEALNLGQRGGLDWAQMWQVIGASAVGSPIVKAKSVQLSQHDYTPTFTVHQMLKDVGLMLQAGDELNVPLPQLSLTQQQMRAAIAQGDGELDYAAIIRVMARACGQNTDL
jgi:3-hydroxyisobutyrate dehydrogenase-like beta-hydroxyacid dehydrogenase